MFSSGPSARESESGHDGTKRRTTHVKLNIGTAVSSKDLEPEPVLAYAGSSELPTSLLLGQVLYTFMVVVS